MLIDKLDGFLYQERGAANFMKQYKVGEIIDSLDKLKEGISEVLEKNQDAYLANLDAFEKINGADMIVNQIMQE